MADNIPNRKNNSTRKTVKSPSGSFELDTPRDRASSFEPQLVKKHQTHLSDEIERKLISMFGLSMNYPDMASHIAELYGLSISHARLAASPINFSRNQAVAAVPTGKRLPVCLAGCHPLQG